MPPVELHIARVIQIHSANINQCGAETQKQEMLPGPAASQPSTRQAIAPDGRKIRDPTQHEQSPQLVWSFSRFGFHEAGKAKTG